MNNVGEQQLSRKSITVKKTTNKAVIFGASIVLFLTILTVFTKFARTQPTNADGLSAVLEGNAIRHGNILLHGWTLSNVSFYTTDLWMYALAIASRGFSPVLARDVPALIYALVVVVSLCITARGLDRRFILPGLCLCFALIGLPSIFLAHLVFEGLLHSGTLLLVLLAFFTIDIPNQNSLTLLRLIGFTFFLAMAAIGDTLAVYIGIIPVIFVCAIRLFQARAALANRSTYTEEIKLIGATTCSLLVAYGFTRLVSHLGGFTLVSFHPSVVSLSNLGRNVRLTVEGLLELFHADIFGQALNVHIVAEVIRLVSLGYVALSIYRAFSMLRSGSISEIQNGTGNDRLTSILFMASAVILAAYLFSTMAINIETTRYLVPVYVYGAILAGRVGIKIMLSCKASWAFSVILLFVNLLPFVQQLRQPAAPHLTAPLTEWLEGHHLLNGYGSYWSANSATAESFNRVRIRPVVSNGHRISPMNWESNATWYTNDPAHFLVIDSTGVGGLTTADATRTFGHPTEIDTIAGRTVLIWTKDITPLLQK